MKSARGQILSFVEGNFGTRAIVDVDAAAACPRCASGKGCGAALFTDSARQVEVSIPPDMNLSAGDFVEVSLSPDNLLHAALIVYGLPLISALLAVALAYGLSFGDMAASLAALSGLLFGAAIARRRLGEHRCLQRFIPTISRRLQEGEVPG
jgi:sigma-E factor negative regulatory protein RseC